VVNSDSFSEECKPLARGASTLRPRVLQLKLLALVGFGGNGDGRTITIVLMRASPPITDSQFQDRSSMCAYRFGY
jgi:hypothetical protein